MRFINSIGLIVLCSAAVGCSDRQAGEIMMGISTNMSLPKDVSAIRLVVSAHGERLIDHTQVVDPSVPDAAKLPGTLAVIQGEDPSMPVTMKVIALQGPERRARVVAKAISTVPSDRIALLNLPIDWLCDENVTYTGDDIDSDYDTACGDGRRCVAGSCVDSTVDGDALGTYTPAKVFGGGSGSGDGSCFDTQPCFENATTAAVALDTCSFTPPSGGSLNIALRTAGDGICGPGGCLVPLDQSDDGAGWVEKDGAVQLPTKACELINEGKAIDIALSTTCETKTVALPTCGPWSATGDSKLGQKGATIIATAQEHPIAIAVQNNRVYWLTTGVSGDAAGGQLKSAPLLGGSPETVTTQKFASPRDLVSAGSAGASNLFFSTYGAAADATSGTLYQLRSDTDAGLKVFSKDLNTPEGVAAFSESTGPTTPPSWTAFTTSFVGGTVAQQTDGGPLITISTGENYPYRIAISPNRQHLVWINEGQLGLSDGSVRYASTDSSNPGVRTIADLQETPRAIAVDDDGACWTTLGESGIPAAGAVHCIVGFAAGAQQVDYYGQFFPSGIAIDATNVYWTNRDEGTVRRAPRAGGNQVYGAVNQYKPGAITLSDGKLYWVNEGSSSQANGSVMSISLSSADWGTVSAPSTSTGAGGAGGSSTSTDSGVGGSGGAGGAAP